MNEINPKNIDEISNPGTDLKETKVQTDVTKNLKEVLNKLNLIPTVGSDVYEIHILSRHVGGLNPGSKALPEASDQLFIDILNKVDSEYQKLIDKEGNPGRKVFVVMSDKPVGTNAVFPIENVSEMSVFTSHRDVGNEKINNGGGQEILCSLIGSDDMPTTNLINVIMGPYGPSGNAGIYTLIFGDEGMPFPRKLAETATERDKEFNEKCKSYWDSHVMLITPKELEKIIELKKECGMSTDVEKKSLLRFIEMEGISPIQKDFTPKPSDGVIEIDLTDN